MVRIAVKLYVPASYIPTDESIAHVVDQHHTLALADYFPRLFEENYDWLPLLENEVVTHEEVAVTCHADSDAKEGYWPHIYIDLDEPHSLTVVNLNTAVRELVLKWFCSKDVAPPPIVHLKWSWRQRSGRLR